MTTWPSFSIVIPTFQRRDVVSECVRALGGVRYRGELELIVVVDGSTDGTSAALADIACPFPVRIIEASNEGASRARNRGASAAVHDVILFLDDDMIAQPGLIEEHARIYREGADAVIGDVRIDPQSPPGFLPHSVARGIASSPVQWPLRPFDILSGQLSVRRTVFEDLGGFDPALTAGPAFGNEDADFGARLLVGHDVRHNAAAVTLQRYVVTPRDYMRRASRAATADLHFIGKHPHLAKQLFELKGAWRPMARFVYRPLGLIPFIPDLLAATAVSLAELSSKTPLRNNRALARFYSGARATAYWSALRRRGWPLNSTLLALCYHAVQDRKDDPVLAPYSVPSELFTEQLDALLRRGYTFITPDQFAAFLFADAPVPRRAALLTFDDGYADLVGPARDALTQRGIRPLVFCVTGFSTNGWDRASGAGTLELLNGNQMREIASAGAEIGSHSRTHRVMLHLEPHELRAEVEGSADEIVRHGLPRPRFFAYPYGARNAAAINAVADAGYLAAFGPNHARMRRSSPLFDLPRVHILASDRGWRFRAKTRFPATYAFVARKVSAVTSRIAKVTASAPHGR